MAPRLLDVIETKDVLGEGPVWNLRDGRLWWTDIQSRRLRRLDPATRQVETFDTPERVGALAFIEGEASRMLVAFETGIALYDPQGGEPEWLHRPETLGSGRRFNDGRTDRQGRFWVGTMVEDQAKVGADTASLWRLDGRGPAMACEGGIGISNSLAVSPDSRTLYFADTPTRRIDAYDLDPETGAISGRRAFAVAEQGFPDGAGVDAGGCLWSARWGGACVVRHAPDGRVLEVVETGASQPTCVAFGGPDLRWMFVTSARDGLTSDQILAEKSAGNVFIFELDAPGLAEPTFRLDRAPAS